MAISIDAARKYLASLGLKLAKYPPSALNGYIRFHLDRFTHIDDYIPALTAKFGRPRIEGGTAGGKHWTWDLGNRRWLVLEWDRDDRKTPYTVALRDGAQKNYYGKDAVTSNSSRIIREATARLAASASAKTKPMGSGVPRGSKRSYPVGEA